MHDTVPQTFRALPMLAIHVPVVFVLTFGTASWNAGYRDGNLIMKRRHVAAVSAKTASPPRSPPSSERGVSGEV